MYKIFFLIVFLFICALGSLPAPAADNPPVPPGQKQRLDAIEKKLARGQKKKEKLKGQAKNYEHELKTTKKRMVSISRDIQRHEQTLQDLEQRISRLQSKQNTLENNLEQDRQSISRLILALQRLRRVPPEALIVKPGAPYKAAQSAMLMQDIIPAIYSQAETLKENLDALSRTTKNLEDKKNRARKEGEKLKAEHVKLVSLIDKREHLYAQTRQDLKAQEKHIRALSQQAKTLQELVQKLSKDNARANARAQTYRAVLSRSAPGSIGSLSAGQLPVSGLIHTGYNEPDAYGAPSKGLTIEGRAGGLVVAPLNGKVMFADHFKNYGNMVILEHEGGYHSLVAGLEKIDTVVGQTVTVGEPLGFLPRRAEGNPSLYYEIRLNGQAVDPAKTFANLKS